MVDFLPLLLLRLQVSDSGSNLEHHVVVDVTLRIQASNFFDPFLQHDSIHGSAPAFRFRPDPLPSLSPPGLDDLSLQSGDPAFGKFLVPKNILKVPAERIKVDFSSFLVGHGLPPEM